MKLTEQARAHNALAHHIRKALKAQAAGGGTLSGDTFDGDFIVGVVTDWLEQHPEYVLTGGGIRRFIRKGER